MIELTDEQYGVVARALVFIASGRRFRDGKTSRIPREELIERAREAAAAIGLRHLGDGGGVSSFPDEVGL